LLSSDLSGTVLLHLSEGVRESIEIIALLTELVLAVLEWSLFQLIRGRGRFGSGLTHAFGCLLELAGLSISGGVAGLLCGLLGTVAGTLWCGWSILQSVGLLLGGFGELVELSQHVFGSGARGILWR